MSQVTRAIKYVENSVNFLDSCERISGTLSPEWERRRQHARRRLEVLYRERSEENREMARELRVFNVMQHPNPRPLSMMVPMGMDESVGSGTDHGYLIDHADGPHSPGRRGI